MKTLKSYALHYPRPLEKPTQRQRELAADICRKLGLEIELPDDTRAYRQFINNHIRQIQDRKKERRLEMSDLISRKDALKAIGIGTLSAATVYGRSEAGMAAKREVERAISELPATQPVINVTLDEEKVAKLVEYRKKIQERENVPNDDLISRQAVIDVLNEMKIYRPLDSDRWVISDCLNKIVNLPSAQPKPIEQIKLERDTAIQQLKDLGYGLGEKPRTDGDTISRQAVIDVLEEYTVSGWVEAQFDILKEEIESLQEPKTAASGSITRTSAEKMHDKTTGDCISRQEALDAIEPILKSILQGNSFKAINVMDKIRGLPSAQPEIEERTEELAQNVPNDDLISRKAAIEIASGYCHPANIAKELAALPAVQPERKKGKWLDEGEIVPLDEFGRTTGWCECSECGEWLVASDEYSMWGNFCPNCGADMRGEQNEGN